MLHDAKLLLPNHCTVPKDLPASKSCEVHQQYRCIWQPTLDYLVLRHFFSHDPLHVRWLYPAYES